MALMRPLFSRDCRIECNEPSGTFAASARAAAFASTCLFASILARSAPSTAFWRALSPGVGAVVMRRRCVAASVGSLAGSAERLFSLSAPFVVVPCSPFCSPLLFPARPVPLLPLSLSYLSAPFSPPAPPIRPIGVSSARAPTLAAHSLQPLPSQPRRAAVSCFPSPLPSPPLSLPPSLFLLPLPFPLPSPSPSPPLPPPPSSSFLSPSPLPPFLLPPPLPPSPLSPPPSLLFPPPLPPPLSLFPLPSPLPSPSPLPPFSPPRSLGRVRLRRRRR